MTVKVTQKTKEVVKPVYEEYVTIEMPLETAKIIRSFIGHVVGGGPVREALNDVWKAFNKAGVENGLWYTYFEDTTMRTKG